MPSRRWGPIIGVAGAGLVAAMFRVPTFLSTRHIGYDDGVYASSVLLMREGLDPFVDFFSSQGPVFLPLLRGFDMTGIGSLRASRLAMVAAGVTISVAIYFIAYRSHGPYRSGVAALAAASSGFLLAAAGPLQSDGPALAFGLLAIALASGDLTTKPWLAPIAGALAGLALATKSLQLVPTVLVALVVIVLHGGRSAVTSFLLSGAFTGVLVTWPWGFDNVWDQYVLFHLEKPIIVAPLDNLGQLGSLLLELELPLIVLLATGVALTIAKMKPTRITQSTQAAIPMWVLASWAISSVLLLLFVMPLGTGFVRFGALIVPPLVLIALRSPISTPLALGFVMLAVPYQFFVLPLTTVVEPTSAEATVIEVLEETPVGSYVVTDSPGTAWSAARLSHPDTVDSSFARIGTGRITADTVLRAADEETSCVYMQWSGRYRQILPSIPPSGYGIAYADGDRFVAVKTACQTP